LELNLVFSSDRPDDELTAEDLRFKPPRLSEDILRPFLQKYWRIDGDLKRLSGERDQNFQVTTADGTQYVYKIASSIEVPELVDFQIQALLHLEKEDPEIRVPRIVHSDDGNAFETLADDRGESHAVRVLSYVPGVPVGSVSPPSLATVEQIGALQGRVCQAFTGFDHDAATHFMPWDIMNGLVISRNLRTDYLQDGLAEICEPSLERLEKESLPRMHALAHQVIHNDAHSWNVMCDPDDPSTITGVIDFGDMVKRPLVVDLATSLTSVIEHSQTPLQSSAALLRGFRKFMAISEVQLDLLYDAVLARAIMTVQLTEFRFRNTQADVSIGDEDLPEAKAGLLKLLAIDPAEFRDFVYAAKATDASPGDKK
jgi:Ser/Thr protein kinase RdoA (MazF antagonist)